MLVVVVVGVRRSKSRSHRVDTPAKRRCVDRGRKESAETNSVWACCFMTLGPVCLYDDRRSWHALFGVAEIREREGRGGRLDITCDETGISADLIEANSQVVRIHVTERKGVAGPQVAHRHGNLEGWLTWNKQLWSPPA
jgi:hypothetical protein